MGNDIFKNIVDALERGEQPISPSTSASITPQATQGIQMVTEGLIRSTFTRDEGLKIRLSQQDDSKDK